MALEYSQKDDSCRPIYNVFFQVVVLYKYIVEIVAKQQRQQQQYLQHYKPTQLERLLLFFLLKNDDINKSTIFIKLRIKIRKIVAIYWVKILTLSS